MFARSRSEKLPPGQTLIEAVEGAPDLDTARRRIDFEISFGRNSAAGWKFESSTLPWKRGVEFVSKRESGALLLSDITPDGNPIVRRWTIENIEGTLEDALVSRELL